MPSYTPMRSFRCEDELYLKVKYVSEQENRSVNRQIVHVLTQFINDYESKNGVIEVNTDALYE